MSRLAALVVDDVADAEENAKENVGSRSVIADSLATVWRLIEIVWSQLGLGDNVVVIEVFTLAKHSTFKSTFFSLNFLIPIFTTVRNSHL